MLGVDSQHVTARGTQYCSSALCVDAQGKVLGQYNKCHLVMFWRVHTLWRVLPFLYSFSPLPTALTPGLGPMSIKVGDYRYAPIICYENTLPHLVREQLKTLEEEGHSPDVVVNLTNDGWFWGSTELDLHLICAVFRAVECRKPLVIAANTGLSASINGSGQILEEGPRREPQVIMAAVRRDNRSSPYVQHGDLLANPAMAIVLILVLTGTWQWLRAPKQSLPT